MSNYDSDNAPIPTEDGCTCHTRPAMDCPILDANVGEPQYFIERADAEGTEYVVVGPDGDTQDETHKTAQAAQEAADALNAAPAATPQPNPTASAPMTAEREQELERFLALSKKYGGFTMEELMSMAEETEELRRQLQVRANQVCELVTENHILQESRPPSQPFPVPNPYPHNTIERAIFNEGFFAANPESEPSQPRSAPLKAGGEPHFSESRRRMTTLPESASVQECHRRAAVEIVDKVIVVPCYEDSVRERMRKQFIDRIAEIIARECPVPQLSAWAVASDTGLRFRTMEQGQIVWTVDIANALHFSRREDAERFSAEDEDAWKIIEIDRLTGRKETK